MPTMKMDRALRASPDGDGIMVAPKGQPVEILATQGAFSQVRLTGMPLKPVGWVDSDAIDPANAPVGPIDKTAFARTCFRQARLFGINAHYFTAIGELRSRVSNVAQNGNVGPFQLSQAEWDASRVAPEFDVNYASTDISDWTAQCIVFAIIAHNMHVKLVKLLGHELTASELYLAQLLGAAGAMASLQQPQATIKDILSPIAAADLPPGMSTGAQVIQRYSSLLATAAGDSVTGATAAQAIDAALQKALDDIRPLVLQAGAETLEDANTVVASTSDTPVQFNFGTLSADQTAMAKLIVAAFAAAGFGGLQQVTAVANAIRKSSLNPNERAPTPPTAAEDSVGLFQLNRQGGEGAGFSVVQLQDPAFNTSIIIKKAKRFPQFASATSLLDAMTVFVEKVEQPANQPAEITKRLKIAQTLLA